MIPLNTTPATIADQRDGPRLPEPLGGSAKTVAIIREDIEIFDMLAKYGAWLVIAGLIAEVCFGIAFSGGKRFWEAFGPIFASAVVTLGIIVEVHFHGRSSKRQFELDRISEENVALANERAAKADLARAELEAKLLPRQLNQEQWDFIQGLRGQFSEVSIAYETDAETWWFANNIQGALFTAGMRVGMVARAPSVHTVGTIIFDPKGRDGARPRSVEPLVEIFRRADVPVACVIFTELPTDILSAIENERPEIRPALDAPMIIVGGRFVIPPPHMEKAAKAMKAAMDATRNK